MLIMQLINSAVSWIVANQGLLASSFISDIKEDWLQLVKMHLVPSPFAPRILSFSLKSPSHCLNGRYLLHSLHISLSHKRGIFVFPQTWLTLNKPIASSFAPKKKNKNKNNSKCHLVYNYKSSIFSLPTPRVLCWAFKFLKLDLYDPS